MTYEPAGNEWRIGAVEIGTDEGPRITKVTLYRDSRDGDTGLMGDNALFQLRRVGEPVRTSPIYTSLDEVV